MRTKQYLEQEIYLQMYMKIFLIEQRTTCYPSTHITPCVVESFEIDVHQHKRNFPTHLSTII